MDPLFDAYPELAERIGILCGGQTWRITGVSALLRDAAGAYHLELTKPKHWRHRPDGATVIGIGAIGGSLEAGETILECLRREVLEEIGAEVAVESAEATYLVYEERRIEEVAVLERGLPRPALFTISRNLYRRRVHPEAEILAIATFGARLMAPPQIRDLYGLLAVSREALVDVLGPPEIVFDAATAQPGVTTTTRGPVPEGAILRPVWTARSLQLLVQASRFP
ncbi:MAG: NUDIX domain-containing protein [Chloroflexi bacterium]|nr:NUDIX domain-containing protein [Chloroflexota bacterium]